VPPAPIRGFRAPDVALLFALGGSWGLSFLFIEFALRGLTPLWIVAARTLVGGLILLVVVRLSRHRMPRSLVDWGHLAVLGVATNALPWGVVAWAQRSLPSGLVALMMAMVPISTLLVSAMVGHERLTPVRLSGLLLGVGGVGITLAADLGTPGRVLAMSVVVAATMLYAGGAVYATSYLSGSMPAMVIATGQVLTAFLITVPAALVLDGPPPIAALVPAIIVPVLALGTFGTGIAFLLFYALIERVGATNTTMVSYLIPIIAVVAGALVLGERLGLAALAGGTLIGIGMWLAQRSTTPVVVSSIGAPAPAAPGDQTGPG
jgi:drug/metabolite transporter (DMT)-like permease